MKQHLLKTWLMLLCLLTGVGTTWAEEADATLTFSAQGYENAQQVSSGTIDSYTSWSATDGTNPAAYYNTGTGLRVYSGGTFSITSSKTIASITLTFSGTGYTFSTSNTTTPQTVTPNATSYSWDVSRTCRLQKIEITYAGGTPPTTYTVTVAEDIANGTVTASHTTAAKDATITLTATPATGYEFDAWDVKDDSDNAITVTDDNTFTMPAANVTVSATFKEQTTPSSDETTVSMTSFSSISGNVGGDTNVSYEAAKGNAGTAPAVNNEQIRVYQNGGLFTITAKDGYKLKSVTIGSAMATSINYKLDGGSEALSSNASIAENKTYTVSDLNNTSIQFICKGTNSSSRLYVNSLSVTYVRVSTPPTPEKELVSISASGTPATFWKGDAFNHNGITVTATWDDESTTDVTSACSYTGYDMATAGQQTVTVTYQEKTTTYDINVETIANTQETAYTIAQAKSLIDAGKDLATKVYVQGTISQVDSYNATYKSITYWISADGTTTDQFEVYSGKNLNNTDFSGKEDLAVGDQVVVFGTIKKYNSTYELDKENYLVALTHPAKPIADFIAQSSVTVNLTDNIDVKNYLNIPEDYAGDRYAITTSIGGETSKEGEFVCIYNKVAFSKAGTYVVDVVAAANGKYAETSGQITFNVISATLQNITLSGELSKSVYTIGEEFDHAGLVVTANYSDASQVDVTESANWEYDPETLNVAGNITINVTATYEEKEVTEGYAITVNKKTSSLSIANKTLSVEEEWTIDGIVSTPADAQLSYSIEAGSEYVSLENNVVTAIALGTATIRADFAGNDEYEATSTTFTVNVTDEKTATITSFSTTSGDINADISYEAFKGNAGTAPGVYNNNLRLYQGGGYVTVTALDGMKIASVKITTSDVYASTTVGYCVDDEDAPTTGVTVAKSSDYTISDLNNQSVSIYCLGTDNKTRLEIAAIEVKYSGTAVKALKSIALSGTYPTEFNRGDEFSHEGMTVTANYTDNTTADVTAQATFSGYDMSKAGTQTVTVSYTEEEITKTAEYEITVKATLTPATDWYETVDFTALEPYASLGTGSLTMSEYIGSSFKVDFAKNDGTAPAFYVNGNAVRVYATNTLTITDAEAIRYVDIAWTSGNEDYDVAIAGLGSTQVIITFSDKARFTAITVYNRALPLVAKDEEDAYFATFSCDQNVEFTAATTTVYTVNATADGITMAEVESKKVPANTGVLIKCTTNNAPYKKVAAAEALTDNMLYPASKAKEELGDSKFYMLAYASSEKDKLGFYWGAADGAAFTSREGSAYLAIPAAVASIKGFSFRELETGIEKVNESGLESGEAYNLQGQRVNANAKGIIIKNGKKYFVK